MMEEKNKDESKKNDEIKELEFKKIPEKLLEYDTIPLFGGAPAFPWKEFSLKLAEHLEQEKCDVSCHNIEWVEEKDLLNHMGKKPFCLSYEVSPLEGHFYTVMDKENLLSLIPFLIFDGQGCTLPSDQDFMESFTAFLSLQIMHTFNEVSYDPLLKPSLVEETTLPKEKMLTADIHCIIKEHDFLLRIFFPKDFQKEVVRYFSQKNNNNFSSKIKRKVKIDVGIEIGSLQIPKEQFDKTKPGDLLLLEKYSLNDEGLFQDARLMVNGEPYCHVEILKDGLKVKKV